MDRVTLFVLHWNQPDACAATLRAFLGQPVPLSVTVVDNHSQQSGYDQLRAESRLDVRFVRLEENKGWGGAFNGVLHDWLAHETNSFCLLSAHDAIPGPNCLPLLLAAAGADPRVGIACPQYAEPFVVRLSRWRGVQPHAAQPKAPGTAEEVDAPHGTLMLVRRECLQEIGLFDERYFAYGDEHELGIRARRAGWKVAMVWGAEVTNPGTSTASFLRSYLFARNSLLLVHDYFGRTAAWVRAVCLLANTARQAFMGGRARCFFAPRARWEGVRDYCLGRFGRPPMR